MLLSTHPAHRLFFLWALPCPRVLPFHMPISAFCVLLQPTLHCKVGGEVLCGAFLLGYVLSGLVIANERKYKGSHDTLTFDIEISATIIAAALETCQERASS